MLNFINFFLWHFTRYQKILRNLTSSRSWAHVGQIIGWSDVRCRTSTSKSIVSKIQKSPIISLPVGRGHVVVCTFLVRLGMIHTPLEGLVCNLYCMSGISFFVLGGAIECLGYFRGGAFLGTCWSTYRTYVQSLLRFHAREPSQNWPNAWEDKKK